MFCFAHAKNILMSQRIHTAGIKRKITHNQVQAIRIVLSDTHEDMVKVQDYGRLNVRRTVEPLKKASVWDCKQ